MYDSEKMHEESLLIDCNEQKIEELILRQANFWVSCWHDFQWNKV